MTKPEREMVSACCRAKIEVHWPHPVSWYSQSPPDPVAYCSECGAKEPEEVEDEKAD